MATAVESIRCICGQEYPLNPQLKGKKVRCGACGHRFCVASPGSTTPSPLPFASPAPPETPPLPAGWHSWSPLAIALGVAGLVVTGLIVLLVNTNSANFDPTNLDQTKAWAKKEGQAMRQITLAKNEIQYQEHAQAFEARCKPHLGTTVRWAVPVKEVYGTGGVAVEHLWSWPKKSEQDQAPKKSRPTDEVVEEMMKELKASHGLALVFHQVQEPNQYTFPDQPPVPGDALDRNLGEFVIKAYDQRAKQLLRRLKVGDTVPIEGKVGRIYAAMINYVAIDLVDCRIAP